MKIKKNCYGFSLIEVLGVIIVLAFLAFLISEVIINNVNDANTKLENLAKDIIISSARDYVARTPSEFPKQLNSVYYITYDQLEQGNFITDEMLPALDSIDEIKSKRIMVVYNGNSFNYSFDDNN